MKRIVMIEGGVETLAFFSKEMAKRFAELGYRVFFYDLGNEEASARKLRKFIRTGETVLITFNFGGLEQEAGVYRKGIGYIWDEYRVPCYNIAADHPYFYDDRLAALPRDYHHISIDRMHAQYFRDYYPEYREDGFLPLAGTRLEGEGGMPCGERPIDVVFTGNYTELSFFEPYINWINEEYAAFYRGIIDELIRSPGETVEAVALRHCEREMGKVSSRELRGAFHKMIFIDMYVRNYWRGMVVKTLVDAGITVHVVGKGWEKLPVDHPECRILHPQTDSVSCLRLLGQSKLSINVMPWFKDGAHDRVFNSILNGALCLTDPSRYLCEELQEGDGVCYYGLTDIGLLPEKVKSLLGDTAELERMVRRGQEKVLAKHTWADRADRLERLFVTDHSQA